VELEARIEEGQPGDAWSTGASSESDGTFEFTFESPGTRTIRAELQRAGEFLVASAVATAGGEPIELRLAPRATAAPAPGALVVRVVDPDGKPVPSADVRLEGRFGLPLEVREGIAEFRLPDGKPAWVWITEAATADGTPLPLGPVRAGPIDPTAKEVTVRLPPEKTIEGVVLGPDGKGVANVTVAASWIPTTQEPWVIPYESKTRTDASGVFRIGRLADVEHDVTVAPPPEFMAPLGLSLAAGTKGVEVRLRAALVVHVTVLDGAGRPVPQATVTFHGSGATTWSATGDARTDERGVARLGGLDAAGLYDVDVRVDGRSDLAPARIREWTPADTTVRLAHARKVKGVIRDRAGQPVTGAHVFATVGESTTWSPSTGADGRFSIEGLATGELVLRPALDGNSLVRGAEVRVAGDDENIVLTLDLGEALVVRVDDWPLGEVQQEGATLFEEGAEGTAQAVSAVAADGTARFVGLSADRTYSLWVAPLADGRSLLQRGVRASSSLRVRLVPGKSITGRIVAPSDAVVTEVEATQKGGPVTVSGQVQPDGSYRIAGLPDGDWFVRARARRGGQWMSSTSSALAGGTVDLKIDSD
jgi:protocatechuate 3,4-dioxygenase beta subunit